MDGIKGDVSDGWMMEGEGRVWGRREGGVIKAKDRSGCLSE